MPLYTPSGGYLEQPGILSVADSWELVQANQYVGTGASSSAVYPTAALGIFAPVRLAQRRTYVRAWWLNGAAVAGNACLGVYTISGTTATQVQTTGAVAQAGTSTMQTSTISWTLDPGLYYLAFSHSEATTGTYWRSPLSTVAARTCGMYQAATQSPLASSVTVVAYASSYCPHYGLAEQAVV